MSRFTVNNIVESIAHIASNKPHIQMPEESKSYSNWYCVQVDITAIDWKTDAVAEAFKQFQTAEVLGEDNVNKLVIHVGKDGNKPRLVVLLHENSRDLSNCIEKIKVAVAKEIAEGQPDVPFQSSRPSLATPATAKTR
jgi:hypothetical protein